MKRIVILLIALVAAIAPLAAQSKTGYIAGQLTPHQQFTREIYKQLIEINTADTTGKVTPAAQAMLQRFKDAGFPDADLFIGGPRPEKHNVVARLHGKAGSTQKPLLLLAHIDVVEALKADWSDNLDPFVFTERDGYYYGRGTADDKAMAAIFVANLIRMKKDGYVPNRDIIVALTADEEGGTANGVDWLLKNQKSLVDAGLVFNEGGGGATRDNTPLFNAVQATEKVFANVTIRTTNKGGHSSVPRADNAITQLSDALAKVGRYHFPIQLNEVTRGFFTETAKVETPAMGKAMLAIVANPKDQAAAAIVTKDPRYNSMLRTTCVATLLKGGHAENALPQLAEANVNCRMFPGDTAEGTRDALKTAINDPGVEVTTSFAKRPAEPPSPLLPELFGPIRQITKDMFGDIPVIPLMGTGATDSRYFRQINVPAFGLSGLFSDPAVDARAHGRDERMRVQSLFEGQEFLYRLTKAITSGK